MNAARNIIGIPELIPPSIPPWLLVRVTIFPSRTANSSLFSLPKISAQPNPLPNSIPFTAGIANTSREITFSEYQMLASITEIDTSKAIDDYTMQLIEQGVL